jgi:hypothetical protein
MKQPLSIVLDQVTVAPRAAGPWAKGGNGEWMAFR